MRGSWRTQQKTSLQILCYQLVECQFHIMPNRILKARGELDLDLSNSSLRVKTLYASRMGLNDCEKKNISTVKGVALKSYLALTLAYESR